MDDKINAQITESQLRRLERDVAGDIYHPKFAVLVNGLIASHRYEDAEKLIAKKIRRFPEVIENYLALASVFSQKRDDRRARQTLRKALSKDPGHVEAGTTLSRMYDQIGRSDDAIRVLRSVAEVSPNPEVARRLSVLMRMREKRISDPEFLGRTHSLYEYSLPAVDISALDQSDDLTQMTVLPSDRHARGIVDPFPQTASIELSDRNRARDDDGQDVQPAATSPSVPPLTRAEKTPYGIQGKDTQAGVGPPPPGSASESDRENEPIDDLADLIRGEDDSAVLKKSSSVRLDVDQTFQDGATDPKIRLNDDRPATDPMAFGPSATRHMSLDGPNHPDIENLPATQPEIRPSDTPGYARSGDAQTEEIPKPSLAAGTEPSRPLASDERPMSALPENGIKKPKELEARSTEQADEHAWLRWQDSGEEPTETSGTPAALFGDGPIEVVESPIQKVLDHSGRSAEAQLSFEDHSRDSMPRTERVKRTKVSDEVERVRYGEADALAEIPAVADSHLSSLASPVQPSVIRHDDVETRPTDHFKRPGLLSSAPSSAEKKQSSKRSIAKTDGDGGHLPDGYRFEDGSGLSAGSPAVLALATDRQSPISAVREPHPDDQGEIQSSVSQRRDGARVAENAQSAFPSMSPVEFSPNRPDPMSTGLRLGNSPSDVLTRPYEEPVSEPVKRAPGLSKRWLGIVLAALSCIVLVVAIAATVRFNRVLSARDAKLEAIRSSMADGNYKSRLMALETLSRMQPVSDTMARLGNWVKSQVGSDSFEARARQRLWLADRVRAELVVLHFDRSKLSHGASLPSPRPGNDTSLDAYVARGLMLTDQNRFQGAVQLGQAAIKQFPRAADAHWLLAVCYERSGALKLAMDAASNAVVIDKDHPHARPLHAEIVTRLAAQDPTRILERLTKLVKTERPNHIGSQIVLARQQIQARKRPAAATGYLQSLLTLEPGYISPYQRALVYDGIGYDQLFNAELEAARKSYAAAAQLVPGRARFLEPLLTLHLREFRIDDAETTLSGVPVDRRRMFPLLSSAISLLKGEPSDVIRQLETWPDKTARHHYLLGLAYLDAKRNRNLNLNPSSKLVLKARRAFAAANGLKPSWAAPKIQMLRLDGLDVGASSVIVRRLKQNRKVTALQDNWQAIFGEKTLSFRAYADVLASRKQYAQAISQYKTALRVDPQDYRSAWGLCRIAALRLRSRETIKWCQKALVNSHFEPARRLLVRAAEQYGDHGIVISVLEPQIEAGRSTSSAARQLVRAYSEMKRYKRIQTLMLRHGQKWDVATRQYVDGLQSLGAARPQDAEKQLAAANSALSNDDWVRMAYAGALARRGRAEKAIDVLTTAQGRADNPRVSLALAQASLDVGRVDDAIEAAKRARRQALKDLSHPRLRAQAMAVEAKSFLFKGSRKASRRAGALILKALQIEPDLPSGLLARGLLAESRLQNKKAARLFSRLIEVSPDSAEAHFRLGRRLLRNKVDMERGRKALLRSIQLDPEGIWGDKSRRVLK